MNKTLIFLICSTKLAFFSAQSINTIAGCTFAAGFSGDGGPAVNAQLNCPTNMAFDALGNIYFVDYFNYRVRKISTTGIISTFAGNGVCSHAGDGGSAINASLFLPMSVAVDGSGNVYISEKNGHRIRKVNAAGIISTFAGTGIAGVAGDGGLAINAQLSSPEGMAFDAAGNLYIAAGRIRKVTPGGIITNFAGTNFGFSGDGGPATSAQLNNPTHIAFDAAGNMYIADSYYRIRKINTLGIISTFAGTGNQGFSGDGGPATSADLFYPSGLAVDGSGNVYFSDFFNHRIRKVNTLGIISTIVGSNGIGFSGDGGSAVNAQLQFPYSVAFDAVGDMYIVDYSNNRIRKVECSSQTLTVNNGSICIGSSFTMVPNGATTYNFSNGSAVVNPTINTSYTVTGYSGCSNIVSQAISNVTVNALPSLTATSSNSIVCAGESTTLTAMGALTYSWSFSNGNSIVIVNPAVSNSYTVFGMDGNGCVNSAVVQQSVTPCTDLLILNPAIAQVKVYPNPNNGQFVIESYVTSQLIISNIYGQEILTQELSEGKTNIDIQEQNDGIYYYKLTGSKCFSGKLVKR